MQRAGGLLLLLLGLLPGVLGGVETCGDAVIGKLAVVTGWQRGRGGAVGITNQAAEYSVVSGALCVISGVISPMSTAKSTKNLALLPAVCRPTGLLSFPALNASGAEIIIGVAASGLIFLQDGEPTGPLALDGLVFAVKSPRKVAASGPFPLALGKGLKAARGYPVASVSKVQDLCVLQGSVKSNHKLKVFATIAVLDHDCYPSGSVAFSILKGNRASLVQVVRSTGKSKSDSTGTVEFIFERSQPKGVEILSLNGIVYPSAKSKRKKALKLQGGWRPDIAKRYATPVYTKQGDICVLSGTVQLCPKRNKAGGCELLAGKTAGSPLLAKLPAECRPASSLSFAVSDSRGRKVKVYVSPNGAVEYGGTGALLKSNYIHLDGIVYAVVHCDCKGVNCGFHGSCEHGKGVCLCFGGWTGKTCLTAPNLCTANKVKCSKHGKCDAKSGKCFCSDDFGGDRCQFAPAVTCPMGCPNQAVCAKFTDGISGKVSGRCFCKNGYTSAVPGAVPPTCDVKPTSQSACKSFPCGTHGFCQESAGVAACSCTDYWTGPHCNAPPNYCALPAPNPAVKCDNAGTCQPATGVCACAGPWKGSYCETPKNVTCSVHGIPNLQTQSCFCKGGWSGKKCSQQPDSCASNPCKHGTCSNTKGGASFQCSCESNWKGDRCEVQVSPCAQTSCSQHGFCTTKGAFTGAGNATCQCSDGYTGSSCQHSPAACYGIHCGHGTCSGGACVCRDGYSGDATLPGTPCTIPRDPCLGVNCGKNGLCANSTCFCLHGFSGSRCGSAPASGCAMLHCGVHGSCAQNGTRSSCACTKGWRGTSCEVAPNVDPCFGVACGKHGVCSSYRNGQPLAKGYCVCLNQYQGKSCQTEPGACPACSTNGACEFKAGVGYCQCFGGFAGTLCAERNPCSVAPCGFKGACTRKNSTAFTCKCIAGWAGKRCSVDESVQIGTLAITQSQETQLLLGSLATAALCAFSFLLSMCCRKSKQVKPVDMSGSYRIESEHDDAGGGGGAAPQPAAPAASPKPNAKAEKKAQVEAQEKRGKAEKKARADKEKAEKSAEKAAKKSGKKSGKNADLSESLMSADAGASEAEQPEAASTADLSWAQDEDGVDKLAGDVSPIAMPFAAKEEAAPAPPVYAPGSDDDDEPPPSPVPAADGAKAVPADLSWADDDISESEEEQEPAAKKEEPEPKAAKPKASAAFDYSDSDEEDAKPAAKPKPSMFDDDSESD